MKWACKLLLILSIASFYAQAQIAPRHFPDLNRLMRRTNGLRVTRPIFAVAPSNVSAPSKSANVISAPCPEPTASLCGYVPVPLDRAHPHGPKIQIYFELYPHTAPGPAQSAILVNGGGPGISTTDFRDAYQFLLANNLDVHDLLLIDDRGRGLSGTIDCEELQHGTVGFARSEIDCAAQLGNAASLYGSGDIADDTEAVRASLGYDLVDYWGSSYGGFDVTAYATRYGEHLRSIVLDAPGSTPERNELLRLKYRTHADPRMVTLDCLRSVLCSQDQEEPDESFSELIEMIRHHPVEGDGHDAFGNLVHIRIDEDALLNFVVTYPNGAFINTGEILAAGDALKHNDPVPLLRLGAEGFFTLTGDSGDPTFISAGAFYATGCIDAIEPWDWSQPVSVRQRQLNQAVSNLPSDYFAPFSKAAANGILFSTLGAQCLWWQRPTTPSPIVPPRATFPHTSTLVLDGDLDNRVPYEETTAVAALFPNSTNVIVEEAGHETANFGSCGITLITNFIETLQPGDTSCANTPETVWPAVGRFPYQAKDARPAAVDPSGVNQAGTRERKTVSVAVATAIDALQRSLINGGDGVGLRSGTFHTDYFGPTTITTTTLTNCVFATDVIVNGTILWGYDGSIVADLDVSGSGTAGGTLHVSGFFETPGPVGNFSVTGTLGGKQVATLVPEA